MPRRRNERYWAIKGVGQCYKQNKPCRKNEQPVTAEQQQKEPAKALYKGLKVVPHFKYITHGYLGFDFSQHFCAHSELS